MGYRLTKIYTRTGDKGSTSLGDGKRVEKESMRMEAIGTVDELNSALGMVLAHGIPKPLNDSLALVQNDLFDLGGELSMPGQAIVNESYVARIEGIIDELNAELPPLENFILPGGGQAASTCHLARAICRRAERRVVALARTETVAAPLLAYINRLSDLLFIAARLLGRADQGEVLWQPGKGEASR